jgi:hypothetical protein
MFISSPNLLPLIAIIVAEEKFVGKTEETVGAKIDENSKLQLVLHTALTPLTNIVIEYIPKEYDPVTKEIFE